MFSCDWFSKLRVLKRTSHRMACSVQTKIWWGYPWIVWSSLRVDWISSAYNGQNLSLQLLFDQLRSSPKIEESRRDAITWRASVCEVEQLLELFSGQDCFRNTTTRFLRCLRLSSLNDLSTIFRCFHWKRRHIIHLPTQVEQENYQGPRRMVIRTATTTLIFNEVG